MSVDRERVKERIRKLLNLGKDDQAASGEIDNAMRMAAELMQAHQLTEAEVAAAHQASQTEEYIPPIDQADAPMHGKQYSTWEFQLAPAIADLVGSVKCYFTSAAFKDGAFSTPAVRKCTRFYGPAEDAALAADLMQEWTHVIATMAMGRFGGCFRGDGAMYALGFAHQLRRRAGEAKQARYSVRTASTSAIVKVGGGMLGHVLDKRREQAAKWLEEEQGVKLSRTGGSGTYGGGSASAYRQGRDDGAAADFTADRRPKLPGGSSRSLPGGGR